MSNINITTLIENNSCGNIKGELGISLLIEHGGEVLLFDTALTGGFIDNAREMGIDLNRVDHCVISHAHMDHAGGYLKFLENFPEHQLILHKQFFTKKYWVQDEGWTRYVGIPFTEEFLLYKGGSPMLISESLYEIDESGIFLLSDVARVSDLEPLDSVQEKYEAGKFVKDNFDEEITVCIPQDDGVVVISGCCHKGVINTCEAAKKAFNKPVKAFIGGTHLIAADEHRIERTIEYLNSENIETINVCHCTGEIGLSMFSESCKHFSPMASGTIIKL